MTFRKSLVAAAIVFCAASAFAADLPGVKILATGGTIAGTAASNTQMTGYNSGALAIQTLIDAVPAIKDIANVSGEQIVKIGSQNMTDESCSNMAKPDAMKLLKRPQSDRHRDHSRHRHIGGNRLLSQPHGEKR